MEFYHRGEKAVPGIASRQAVHGLDDFDRSIFGHFGDHVFVLFAFKGTGGVNEHAAGSENFESVLQKRRLPPLQIGQIARIQLPFDLRIARQGSGAGTGYIDENPIELSREGQGTSAVQRDERNPKRFQRSQPVRVEIAGNSLDAGFESLCGFVAWRGAQIEERLTRSESQQGNDRLRADILNAPVALVSDRRGEIRQRDRFRLRASKRPAPTVE